MIYLSLKTNLLLFALSFTTINFYAQCNGADNICAKKYNEVAYLTTHNAYNATQDTFQLPNQTYNIATQLKDGVRGLMIDVYEQEGKLLVYHGFPNLGTALFTSCLTDIKLFLQANPNEVVTIILECYATANAIEAAFVSVGLEGYLFAYNKEETTWPSLQTMVDNNKRLVVFTDVNDANEGQEWYHYVWDYAVETHYSNKSIEDFSCDFNRGSAENDIFILNHFITNVIGVGVEYEANNINENPYFINRVLACQQTTSKFPNFITIDFYNLGDGLEVVNTLNKQVVTGLHSTLDDDIFGIYPNPTNQLVIIEKQGILVEDVVLLNLLMQNQNNHIKISQLSSTTCRVDLQNLIPGLYILKVGKTSRKIMVN